MPTFLEGVGSISIACTLAMLVPGVALVLVARKARLTVALFYLLGATLLTWARAAGHWQVELSGAAVFVAAALAAGAFVLALPGQAARRRCRPPARACWRGRWPGGCGGRAWGRGSATSSTTPTPRQRRTLGMMLVYMAGALLPAVLLAVLPHALPGSKSFLDRLPVVAVGGAVGAAYAVTLAAGRYDDLIGELYRIATGA